jgi:hypothetical protein
MVHPSLLLSLEKLRQNLSGLDAFEEVEIIIASGLRTQEDNAWLGEKYGYTEAGGDVSRDSKHLPEYGGIAADFWARRKRDKKVIPTDVLLRCAQQVFDFCKAYKDGKHPEEVKLNDLGGRIHVGGHVHGDNRNGGLKVCGKEL